MNHSDIIINVDQCNDAIDDVITHSRRYGNTVVVSTENNLSQRSLECLFNSKVPVVVLHTTKVDNRLNVCGENTIHTAMYNFILGAHGYEAMDVDTCNWTAEIEEMHGVKMNRIENQLDSETSIIQDLTNLWASGKILTGIEEAPGYLQTIAKSLTHTDLNYLHDKVMEHNLSEHQLIALIASRNKNQIIIDWDVEFIEEIVQGSIDEVALNDICKMLHDKKQTNVTSLPGIRLNFMKNRTDNSLLNRDFVDINALTSTKWFECLKLRNQHIIKIELQDIRNRYHSIGLELHELKPVEATKPKHLVWVPKNENRGAYKGEHPKEKNPVMEGKVIIGSGRGFGKCSTIIGVADVGYDGLHGVNTELITTKESQTTDEWKRVCDEIEKLMIKFNKAKRNRLISVTANAVCYATECYTINICNRGNEIRNSDEVFNIPCDLTGYELANVRVYALTGLIKGAAVQIRNGNMSPGTTSNTTWNGLMASHSKYGAEVSCYTGHSEDMGGLKNFFRNYSPLADLRGYEECILNQCLLARGIKVTVKEVYGKLRYEDNEIYINGWGLRPALKILTLNNTVEEYGVGYEASRWDFTHLRHNASNVTIDYLFGNNSSAIMTWRPEKFNETIILNRDETMSMMYNWEQTLRSGLMPGYNQAVGLYKQAYTPINCRHGQQPYVRTPEGSIMITHTTGHMHRCWERSCRSTQNKGIHGLSYKEVLQCPRMNTNLNAAEFLIKTLNNLFLKADNSIKFMITANHTYTSPGYHLINLTTAASKFEVVQLPGMTEIRLPGVTGRALAHLRLCVLFTKARRRIFMMNGTTIAQWEKDVYELEHNSYLKRHEWCSINQVVPSHFCAGGFGYSGILRGKLDQFLTITSLGAHIYGVEEAMIAKQLASLDNTCFVATRQQLVMEWHKDTQLEAMTIYYRMHNGELRGPYNRPRETYGERCVWYAKELGIKLTIRDREVIMETSKETIRVDRVFRPSYDRKSEEMWLKACIGSAEDF
ncbi:hypothetical protein [Rhizoctonia solani endornavirus 1]|uniref:hypothetical protein n=1 Tax=Rhizoctonia solani endornavirus 1 TaxID=2162642 RepID=UPI000D3EF1B4|nr:hypothetical protein [Rhizoctonia solani endornavirus 1]AVZ46856.1 hypothetical protein [Rhizoctonia solani endornavirus 1]